MIVIVCFELVFFTCLIFFCGLERLFFWLVVVLVEFFFFRKFLIVRVLFYGFVCERKKFRNIFVLCF